jgi:hypothetical protein
LLHFVGQGDWSDQQVLAKVREMVLPEIERHCGLNGTFQIQLRPFGED